VVGSPLLIPVVALAAITAVPVLRARRRVPEAVARLRGLLDAGEAVLGDGIGVVRGAPAGLEFGVLAVVGAVCLVSGYVSGTRASIAYIAPLNLLATPAFFFADAGGVLLVMVMLSLVGIAGLVAGATLGRRASGRARCDWHSTRSPRSDCRSTAGRT
jgi:hypothetical protein